MATKAAYRVKDSTYYLGKTEDVLQSKDLTYAKGKADLIFFSPPFPLNRKKKYGNFKGEEYKTWLASFAPLLKEYLSERGSIVIELGNSWEPGAPVMSTLALEAMLEFKRAGDLFLCQQFIWSNPAKLPTPAQWVNVDRVRVKDSFTHIWWLAATPKPKADNRKVLKEYSPAMKELLRTKKYNGGKRPSEHHIGETSFFTDNEGAIPSSVLVEANTGASSTYLKYCRENELKLHPARMPIGIPSFFINFLTDPGDLVIDPFAGSGTTCEAAERLGRRWMGIEASEEYARGSMGRFPEAVPEALRKDVLGADRVRWLISVRPRSWQEDALQLWGKDCRGVVAVVTGGGKTTFAQLCMQTFEEDNPEAAYAIVVPTTALLDQWYVSLREDLGVAEGEIACFSGQERANEFRKVNLFVLNTARELAPTLAEQRSRCFLIVDECHRAGSVANARALRGPYSATLGLSATPEREYDAGFEESVVPALGPVVYRYGYVQAREDGVITPFDLVNVQIDLLPSERADYDRLTRRLAALVRQVERGEEPRSKLVRLLQQRAAVSAAAALRVPVAAGLLDRHRGARAIVFHERVESAEAIQRVLSARGHSWSCPVSVDRLWA